MGDGCCSRTSFSLPSFLLGSRRRRSSHNCWSIFTAPQVEFGPMRRSALLFHNNRGITVWAPKTLATTTVHWMCADCLEWGCKVIASSSRINARHRAYSFSRFQNFPRLISHEVSNIRIIPNILKQKSDIQRVTPPSEHLCEFSWLSKVSCLARNVIRHQPPICMQAKKHVCGHRCTRAHKQFNNHTHV